MINKEITLKNVNHLMNKYKTLPIKGEPPTFKPFALTAVFLGLLASQSTANASNLANASTFSEKSSTWQSGYNKAFDGNNNNEARAKIRGNKSDVWLTFDFGQAYSNFDVSFLEDNKNPFSVSHWKVQGWKGGEWQDINNWKAHNSTGFNPKYPIDDSYTTNKMRILFKAAKGQKVGLNEIDIVGTPKASSGPTPKAIVDSDFYTAPKKYDVSYNLVNDYGVDNTDTLDDSALLQKAIDDISKETNGGKLFIPNGDYYFLSVQMRSNVHIEIAAGATLYPTPNDDGRNHRIFEVGTFNNAKVENFSLKGRGKGFTVDFRKSADKNLAVFNLGDLENFKISNFTIQDKKTIFASFLVGVTRKGDDLYWPVNGIIEKITQKDALFGYGVVQTYGADNILFRDLDGEGGITLRMETDNLVMKELKQGGIRNIFAENISCTNGLSAVMFGPHFIENGAVQVNGVESNGCGFTVRVDKGFVELFSPANETHTRQSWKEAVEEDLGAGCSATPYARGNGGTRWAARINDVGNCLTKAFNKHKLKPGTFAESNIFNVTSNYGTNAHLKQDQLDYFETVNATCNNVCLPTKDQWSKQGQIYLGPSIAGVIDKNVSGRKYNFDINVFNLNTVGYPNPHHEVVDSTTSNARVCNYYGMNACPDARWDK